MDVNLMRSIITTVLFVVFIGIVLWAWSKGRRADFEAAARLPLDDDLAEQQLARDRRVQQ
ncbi:MAG: cbb3-type cytochrome c oxidase subunit 3 [Burkholderiales bacterium]|jgi:cytochrome c oxidase cbb3-type subunit 4|nr:cbb3-type cytochrome c oxidase subunit 3 [Burkholderiales bacterium]